MAKKKIPFIQLSVAFLLIIILSLFFSWGNHHGNGMESDMMEQSMGNMMGEMNLKEIKVSDLISQQQESEITQEDSHAEHHNVNGSFLQIIHRLTTASIIIVIPFIIAGSIFLFIIWFNKS